ncbi:GNAT family N-acetyltransferase [Bordetella genomosp. 13]|uniref:GNAT family N-acetyltransferase n=1 Tax=Bordetella genomosp. 13 TaxID=463040 RepID=UPI00119F12D8|nr:GNAT family N-acetyltransferase [Bordetella genomosp. 13]
MDTTHTPPPGPVSRRDARAPDWISYALGLALHVDARPAQDSSQLLRIGAHDGPRSLWTLHAQDDTGKLHCQDGAGDDTLPAHTLAALDAAFGLHPALRRIDLPQAPRLAPQLASAASPGPGGSAPAIIPRAALWQLPALWLPPGPTDTPYAEHWTWTGSRRHPARKPQPSGVAYRRFIPWLGRTLTLRSADPDADLPHFHRWMNDPHVAEFWQETGTPEQHRAYLARLAADAHAAPLIAALDDTPFAYVETYWAQEDRLAPYYDADDYDRGWHVLVGEPAFRGKDFLTAWMPSVSHYLLLDDCRTRRIVIEPRADNARMIRSLGRCGYALQKEFDFPHKRAMLGMLLRERFFSDALWIPG